MSKKEYLEQLRKYLRRLPKEDYDNAMDYFTEYLEEVGAEGEQQAMEELGMPKKAAGEVLSQLLLEKTEENQNTPSEMGAKKKTPIGTILLIAFLALFTVPIGGMLTVALLMAAGTLLFAAGILLVSVLLVLICVSFAGILMGGKLMLRGLIAISVSPSGSCIILGTGFLFLGLGILFLLLMISLIRRFGGFIRWLVRKIAAKRVKKAASKENVIVD